VTQFVAPPLRADASFHRCECGHSIYDHGRLGKDGNQLWVGCHSRNCECTTFRASDGSPWPTNNAGATLDDPQDLDLDTVHWIDGRVYLSTDEPPL
jgi:hypothetical protein